MIQRTHKEIHTVQLVEYRLKIIAALKACSRAKDLKAGRKLHASAMETGIESNIYVASTLIDMYSKCGCMKEAENVFEKMRTRNTVSWNALVRGYVLNGEAVQALEVFVRMQVECAPDGHTFVAALKACGSLATKEEESRLGGEFVKVVALEKGMAVHAQVLKAGCDSFVENALVDMYSKCRSMSLSREVFERMRHRDVVSWTTVILGYAQAGEGAKALLLFECMQAEGCQPNALTFLAVLKACGSLAEKEEGRQVDGQVVKVLALEKGLALHHHAVLCGFHSCVFVGSTLIDMYAKCGCMGVSRTVFESMEAKDVVSWTALILGYAEAGEYDFALELFTYMSRENCSPNNLTYVAALKACSSQAAREEATQVEGKLLKVKALERIMALQSAATRDSYSGDIFVASTLVDVYSACGSMTDAWDCFQRMPHRSVVTWTALLLGFAQNGDSRTALELFDRMQSEGFKSDDRALVAGLKVCVTLAKEGENKQDKKLQQLALKKGRSIHLQAKRTCSENNRFLASGLVEMYVSCGCMTEARNVFDKLVQSEVMLWNLMISGCADTKELCVQALEFFSCMDCQPDAQTYVAALKACSTLAAVEDGKEVHAQACKCGLDGEEAVVSSLVDFYGRSGKMTLAELVFESASSLDLLTWTALLAGYSRQGDTESIFSSFHKCQEERLQPDGFLFNYILTACSHAGMVEKGRKWFHLMSSKYGVRPDIKNYHTMIDMLGRANQLEEAVTMARNMPFEPNTVTWMTILGACRKWNNVTVAKIAFEYLVSIDKNDTAAYVLMRNILSDAKADVNLCHP